MENRDLSPNETELKLIKESLDDVVETRETLDKISTLGKIGITYLGLRAFGILCEIGPELDPNNPAILDSIGVTLTYVCGASWLAGKLLQYDERSARKDYEKALGKLV